jgi:hypothetical protein
MDNVELHDTILKALREAAEACTSLAGYILQSAEHLRSGEIREGNELLSRILDDFSVLVSFLEDVRRCTPLNEGERDDSMDTLDQESREMADLLNMAVGAQENEDWVYLADILEYEFSQKLGSWDGLLKGMAQSREAQPGW